MKDRYCSTQYIPLLISVLLLTGSSLLGSVLNKANSVVTDPFKQGLSELENGNPRQAVEIWAETSDHSGPDYRIGYYFIKTVTANNMREHYEKASALYYRGLTTGSIDDEGKELLLTDLEFIQPLMSRREGNRLEELIEERNPAIYKELADFWNSMKVTVTDPYNARLVEHWERIAYALENFATSSRQAYDDRGHTYIKYGAPERSRAGMLIHDPGFANYILATRMDDGVDGSGDVSASTIFLNTLYQVRDYHTHASYEVWVYSNLSDQFNNIPFIFGNESGGNVMRLKHSVDDFIPSGAYSTGGRNEFYSHGMSIEDNGTDLSRGNGDTDAASEMGGGVTSTPEEIPPAVVLQIMYYRQLSTIDTYFSSRYEEMLDRYESTINRMSSSIAREFQQLNISELQRTQRNAPDNQSSHINTLHRIEAEIYAYRFLDDELDPYLRIYHIADTEDAITVEELKRTNDLADVSPEKYQLVNNVSLYDENGINLYTDTGDYSVDQNDCDALNLNLVKIPHPQNLKYVKATFELHDIYTNRKEIAENSTFRQYLKGIGDTELEIPGPLKKNEFNISDIILGYTERQYSNSDKELRLSHDRRIPQNTSLNFYYEVYDVPRNSEGLFEFSLTYKIKKERSRLGRLLRFWSSDEASITIVNVHDDPIFSQQLEIISEELDPGDYILELAFKGPREEPLHQEKVIFTIN